MPLRPLSMKNKCESRRPDGEGGIVIIRKFSLGRRRGALFAFCDVSSVTRIILIELPALKGDASCDGFGSAARHSAPHSAYSHLDPPRHGIAVMSTISRRSRLLRRAAVAPLARTKRNHARRMSR